MARILLIHGAWCSASTWDEVLPFLSEAGHQAKAIDLPGHGARSAEIGQTGLVEYGAAIVADLERFGEAVLVGHSMGGMAISAAAESRPDLVRSLIYVAAFLPRDGDSLLDLKKRERHTIGGAVCRGPIEHTTVLDPIMAAEFLFQDASERQKAIGLSRLCPQANAPQTDRIRLSAGRFGSVSRDYVVCSRDNTITPELQRKMSVETPCERVEELASGHFPQLTRPGDLAALIGKFAGLSKIENI